MKKIIYPAEERIIEYNLLALNLIKIKKADRAEVLSYKKNVRYKRKLLYRQ